MIADVLDYRTGSASLGSAQNPGEWVSGPGVLTGDTNDIIQIRLDD